MIKILEIICFLLIIYNLFLIGERLKENPKNNNINKSRDVVNKFKKEKKIEKTVYDDFVERVDEFKPL